MTVSEKLTNIRERMKRASVDALYVPSEDDHGSEYVCTHFRVREYLSGFTGSAGSLIITATEAALFTDGRYFLQAAQLEGTPIRLMRSGEPGVPTPTEYLIRHCKEGDTVAYDGRCVSAADHERYRSALAGAGIGISYVLDLAGEVWEDRPAVVYAPIRTLPAELCGKTRAQKIAEIREKMRGDSLDALLVSSLEEIAYTLNLRGDDIPCTPVFFSFLFIGQEETVLYVNSTSLTEECKQSLTNDGIRIREYDRIYREIAHDVAGKRVGYNAESTNILLCDAMKSAGGMRGDVRYVRMMKAQKTEAEIRAMKEAHRKDGIALTKFIHRLKTDPACADMTECEIAALLASYRREDPDCSGPSFETICAYGENGAIVHYKPEAGADRKPDGAHLCLVDSGGQYPGATTDVTRTVVLCAPTAEEKRAFTLCMISHLRLQAARFPVGTVGENLDVLARQILWQNGMDYKHGTGHGVGAGLSVHENPPRIHWRVGKNTADNKLLPGMIFSDEPGFYAEGKFGIRHENLELVVPVSDGDGMLCLCPLTLAPYDPDGIDVSLMDGSDLILYNAYQENVRNALSPYLTEEERIWLGHETRPLKKNC